VQRLPFDVRELVEQSPSVTGHGAPVLGARHTTVHYLGREDGAQHNSVHSDPRRAAAAPPLTAERWAALSGVTAAEVLVLGQVQHVVEAVDPLSGRALWNVSHAAWRHLPIAGVETASAPLLDVAEGALPVAKCQMCVS
jgi:hypothetical protein